MTWALVLSPVARQRSHPLCLAARQADGPGAAYGGDEVDLLTVRLMGPAERLVGPRMREALGPEW